jgi:hypothetical protein
MRDEPLLIKNRAPPYLYVEWQLGYTRTGVADRTDQPA